MADKYIERGALLAMCKRQIECEWNTIAAPGTWADAFEDFSDLVEQTPAADVVEVVRFKDCKHYGFYYGDFKNRACCYAGVTCRCEENHFCGYGERKDKT